MYHKIELYIWHQKIRLSLYFSHYVRPYANVMQKFFIICSKI